MNNDEEKIVTLIEQGNFGLGIQEVQDEKEKQELKEKMKNNNH